MNKSEQTYRNKQFILDFIDPEGCCRCDTASASEEYDEAISDCMGMLQHSIDVGDEEEIAFWRRMLQEAKVGKRLAKSEGLNMKGYSLAS